MTHSQSDLTLESVQSGKELSEISRLALETGSEEDEINETIKRDKIFVAKRKGKVVGFLSLMMCNDEKTVEVSGLAVKAGERRRGVAKLLIRHAEKYAIDRNARKLVVRTSNDNIPALTLYQKERFKMTGVKIGKMVEHHGAELTGWQGIPVRDEIVLEKQVSQNG
ncbi:MAG: GNAT family N-acetyltransferase [Candidatus Atabeyarchaeum deiterrae]